MLLAANWLFSLIVLFPHGDLDQRIREISLQIEASPSNMTLRMERGELYVQHEEYDKAKTDFSLCLKMGFDDIRVMFGLSNSYLQTGPVDSSIYFIDMVLAREPSHISAIELKSIALSRLGKYCESARLIQEVISLSVQPAPLLFIQSASAWKSCNEPGNMEMAILILKAGLDRLPDNRVLQHHLITAYKNSKMYEEALEIQTSIIQNSTNKVRPFLNRAKTYIETGLIDNASIDLQSALTYWESLPLHKKDVPAMQELKNEIEFLLNARYVTTSSDNGSGSLREIITLACEGDTIYFSSAINDTIELNSEIIIDKNLCIKAEIEDDIVISGNLVTRIFNVGSGIDVTLSELTLTKGFHPSTGGAVLNNGTLFLEHTKFIGNMQGAVPSAWTNNNQIWVRQGLNLIRPD